MIGGSFGIGMFILIPFFTFVATEDHICNKYEQNERNDHKNILFGIHVSLLSVNFQQNILILLPIILLNNG